MRPKVVNVKHDDYDVYGGRDSRYGDPKWGNPFTVRDHGRGGAIERFRRWFPEQEDLIRDVADLRGKRIGCHCKPRDCHCDILVEWAMKTRILVCGPRDFDNALYVHCVMLGLRRRFGDFVLIEGEANGVDTLARKSAQVMGLTIIRFPADWSRGRSAGPQRNREMVEKGKPDYVVGIGYGKGTADMMQFARFSDLPTIWRATWWKGASAR